MKKSYLVILIILLASLTSIAQKDFVWSEVVKVDPSLTRRDLLSNARFWMAKVYGPNDILLMDDYTYTIMIQGNHKIEPLLPGVGAYFSSVQAGWVSYTLTIGLRDGEYKYTLDQCYHKGGGEGQRVNCGPLTNEKPWHDLTGYGLTTKFWNEELKPDFLSNTEKLLSKFKIAMNRKLGGDVWW